MTALTDPNMTPEDVDRILTGLAEKVRKRRLEMPAILALEMHKPLANVLGHGAAAMAPFLVPLFGYDATHQTTAVLSDSQNVERLIEMLETSPENPS